MFGLGSLIGMGANLIGGLFGGGGGSGVQGAAAQGQQAIDAASEQGIQNQIKNAWNEVAVQAVNEASGITQKATQA